MKVISRKNEMANKSPEKRKTINGVAAKILLAVFYLGVILMCVASDNPKSVISPPVTFGFGSFLSVIFFILLLLFVTYVLKQKSLVGFEKTLSFLVTPVTMFFALFIGYFSLQYLMIGGYDQRVFGYFSIFFPLLSYLTFSLIPVRTLKRFLKIFVLSVSIVLIGQSLCTVTYINMSEDSVVAENKTDVDSFIAKLCEETSYNTPACENTAKGLGEQTRDAVHKVKNYSFKDMYQLPLGGSNYIADLLLICLAAALFIPGLHIGFKLLLYLLVGTTIFLFESFGGILGFLLLSLLLIIFKREAFDSVFQLLTGHSLLHFIRRRKKALVRIGLVFVSFFVAVVIAFFSYAAATKRGSDRGFLDVLSTGRVNIYRETLHYVGHRPTLGFGFQFDAFMDKPHNLFLALLAYGGVVGFVVTLLLFVSLIIYSFGLHNSFGKMFISMTVVTVFHGMIEPTLFNACADFLFWTFAGIALSIGSKINSDSPLLSTPSGRVSTGFRLPRAVGAIVILSAVIPLTVSSSNQYVAIGNVDITHFNSDKAGVSLPRNKTTSKAVLALLEASTGARTLEDRNYLRELDTKYKIDLDPRFPNDSLYFYWDSTRKSLAIRFLVTGGSKKSAEAKINELGQEYAEAVSGRYPYLTFTYTGSEVVGGNAKKILVLKIAFGIMTLVSWYLLYLSAVVSEFEIRRGNSKGRKEIICAPQ